MTNQTKGQTPFFSYCSTSQESAKNEVFLSELNDSSSMMYDFSISENVRDVFLMARAFLSISEMTHKKLQKLCYYAKAWHLALYDENIISDQLQAWVHGAVQPSLYNAYKQYGFNNIPRIINKKAIPENFISFALEVYDSYGSLSGDELEAINHTEEPWIKARGNCRPWENCNAIISEDDIKDQ